MAKWKLEVVIDAIDLEHAWNVASTLPRDFKPQSLDDLDSFKLTNTETGQTVFFGTEPQKLGSITGGPVYPPGVRAVSDRLPSVPTGIYAPGTK